MPQTIEQGDIFGKIGKSIGQGVSEQAERSILSQGLERIASDKNLTPLQRYSKLVQLPGGAALASQIHPFLQEQAEKDIYEEPNAASPASSLYPSEPLPKKTQQAQKMPQQTDVSNTKGVDRTSPFYLIHRSPEDLGKEAAALSTKKGLGFDRALKIVEERDKSRVARNKEFEEGRQAGLTRFDAGIARIRQKSGENIFQDVSGRGLQDFIKDYESKVDSGKNPILAADETISDLDRYADAKINLIGEGQKSYLGRSAKRTAEIIEESQKEFSKVHREEDMKNILIKDHSLSEDLAASFAYPIQESSSYKKLKSLPPIPKGVEGIGQSNKSIKGAIEFAQSIAADIKSSDSIQSIAHALGIKGYDKNAFVDEMRRLSTQRVFEPNDRQSRELLKSPPSIPSLGDIYFKFFGEKKR